MNLREGIVLKSSTKQIGLFISFCSELTWHLTLNYVSSVGLSFAVPNEYEL
jgi:hypothetical protein